MRVGRVGRDWRGERQNKGAGENNSRCIGAHERRRRRLCEAQELAALESSGGDVLDWGEGEKAGGQGRATRGFFAYHMGRHRSAVVLVASAHLDRRRRPFAAGGALEGMAAQSSTIELMAGAGGRWWSMDGGRGLLTEEGDVGRWQRARRQTLTEQLGWADGWRGVLCGAGAWA